MAAVLGFIGAPRRALRRLPESVRLGVTATRNAAPRQLRRAVQPENINNLPVYTVVQHGALRDRTNVCVRRGNARNQMVY